MKTVYEGSKNVLKLLGKQHIKDTVYRRMKYVLQAECDEGVLLHNVITGKLVILDKDETRFLQLLPCKCLDLMNDLIEDWFLVPVNYIEKETVNTIRTLMNKVLGSKGIDTYTIFTTTNCNARCFYCYQSNYSHINMSNETANKAVSFINEHKGEKPVHLSWFGGEPLVGIKVIDHICNELVKRSIDFNSSMISNGYLFQEEIVERAIKNWNLKSVQITVDGTEAIYNRTKAYVSVSGSPYKRVLENIELLLKRGIRVNIRLNLDQHNGEDLKDLIDYLLARFEKYAGFDIYTHVLYEDEGFAPISRNNNTREKLFKLQTELNSRIINRGYGKYHTVLPHIKLHSCMADSMNSAVIYPDGTLYKCEHVTPGDEIGNLVDGIIDFDKIKKFQTTSELEKCSSCVLMPACLLLKECEGVKDRNSETCNFDLASRTSAIVDYYKQWREKSIIIRSETLDITEIKC